MGKLGKQAKKQAKKKDAVGRTVRASGCDQIEKKAYPLERCGASGGGERRQQATIDSRGHSVIRRQCTSGARVRMVDTSRTARTDEA